MVASAISLVVALAALLLALNPLSQTSVGPRIGAVPGGDAGLGGSSPAAPGRASAVAPAEAAGGGAGGPAPAAAATVAASGPRAVASLASARAVTAVVASSPAKPPAAEAPPVAAPEQPTASAPEPVAVPVEAPAVEPVAAVPVQVPYAPGFQPGPVPAAVEPPPGIPAELLEVRDGDEGETSFPFIVEATSFGAPGEDDSIMRFAGPAGEEPAFALHLWDDGTGQRGLWASGGAAGGERFLAPLSEGEHELSVEFVASSEEDGLYRVVLDGRTVDWRAWVRLLPAGGVAWLETQP